MATIVRHLPTGTNYLLIGTGYGAWATATTGPVLGPLAPSVESGAAALVAVTGTDGKIGWVPSQELLVLTVDGKTPHQALAESAGPYR